MLVCVSVLYRNPNRWTDLNEIWHRGGPRGFFDPIPPPGFRVRKGGLGCLWSLNHAFWQKLYKPKLLGTPDLVGAFTFLGPKSGRTWTPCPSGAMVTHYEEELIKLKL